MHSDKISAPFLPHSCIICVIPTAAHTLSTRSRPPRRKRILSKMTEKVQRAQVDERLQPPRGGQISDNILKGYAVHWLPPWGGGFGTAPPRQTPLRNWLRLLATTYHCYVLIGIHRLPILDEFFNSPLSRTLLSLHSPPAEDEKWRC